MKSLHRLINFGTPQTKKKPIRYKHCTVTKQKLILGALCPWKLIIKILICLWDKLFPNFLTTSVKNPQWKWSICVLLYIFFKDFLLFLNIHCIHTQCNPKNLHFLCCFLQKGLKISENTLPATKLTVLVTAWFKGIFSNCWE